MNASIQDVEDKYGIALPRAYHEFCARGTRTRDFIVFTPDDLLAAPHVTAAIPGRVFPLLATHAGDLAGLYYPRQSQRPFAVAFYHEESVIVPLTSNLERFFGDPDTFALDKGDICERVKGEDASAWSHLIIRWDAAEPAELELLKPLSLHYRKLEEPMDKGFDALFRRFSATAGTPGAIRELFLCPLDLHRRAKWFALAERLAAAGDLAGAIQALDNCSVILLVFPYYGDPDSRVADKVGWPWTDLTDVLIRMEGLVRNAGDVFDRITIPHRLRLAKASVKRARARAPRGT